MLVPGDVFLVVASVLWQRLPTDDRKAIRASCRSGRRMHDSLLKKLNLKLGVPWRLRHLFDEELEEEPLTAPTPSELRTCVDGVLQRGARLQDVNLMFEKPWLEAPLPPQEREEQLLAVLGALRSCPLPRLTLFGGVPSSPAIATALADCCRHLKGLCLRYHPGHNDLADTRGQADHGYGMGVQRLLTDVGPRLRELEVAGSAHHWPAEAWGALRHCTGLTKLTVEVGVPDTPLGKSETYLDSASTETSILETVAQLTKLRSLRLLTVLDPDACTHDALTPHATSVACLSTLTGLTSLELEPSRCYEFHAHRYSLMLNGHGLALEETCEAHRTSLLSALRAMPQLQHLHCPTLWLRPSEAAPLNALTSLTVGGLLPPSPPGAGPRAHLAADMEADAAPGGQHRREEYAEGVSMPAGLQELRLSTGASPCTLAALQLPASIRSFRCGALMLGCRDVEQLRHIKEETLQAIEPAVQLLSRPETCCARDILQVVVDAGPKLLRPRQDTPGGHTEWLQQLAGLDAFGIIVVRGVSLRAGDVGCIVRMWPNVRSLGLRNVVMPVAALPLLAGMTKLRDVTVEVSRMEHIAMDELAAALCVLGQQAGSSLEHIKVVVHDAYEGALGFADAICDYLDGLGKGHVHVGVMALQHDEE